MKEIRSTAFNSPVIATDPVSKGTFRILTAWILHDYGDYEADTKTRCKGNIIIEGAENQLFKIGKEQMLRLQGLVAAVILGNEKRFIRFTSISNYRLCEDESYNEIKLDVVFDVLDNLEYVENVIDYKNIHLL